MRFKKERKTRKENIINTYNSRVDATKERMSKLDRISEEFISPK